ncbi:MAG TPA: tripartite tricarboxylate transporter substrate binding protein [Burkholderiales bacterium]|nr:tripartite tricarboxylate transporter substrate binding protein [Burkholderiales bacterium]
MRKTLIAFAALALAAGAAVAQDTKGYPSKPIRMIVGYAPGGGVDIMARLIGPRITEALGQQVIVENRPGAGQNIGAEIASRAAPDGYTLFLASSALGINVSLYPKLSYDPIKSFVPIAVFAQSPNLLLVHPSMPVGTAKEFIAFARKNPGKLNFSSSGSGSTQHLSGELLKLSTGVRMTHIPYKGSAPSLTALVSGEVDFAFNNIPSAQPFLQQNRLKALAITSRKRSKLLPNVPTLIESGLKDFEVAAWYGVLAPAGTPNELVTRLNGVINAAVQSRDFNDRLAKLGADTIHESPQFFADFLKEEIERWHKVIKAAGAKPE